MVERRPDPAVHEERVVWLRGGSGGRATLILLGTGAGLVGYLGLGIELWQVAPGFLVQSLYVSLVIVAGLLVVVSRQATLISELQDDLKLTAAYVGQVEQMEYLAQGTFGLVVNLLEEPRVDTVHRCTAITEEYFVHGSDGTFNWTFEGECVADRSMEMVIKVSGDSPCDENALSIAVTDELNSGRMLDYIVLTDRPYCKVLAVFFGKPLRRGDRFKLRFSCRWDNTFPRSRRFDYVFSQWGAYVVEGVDRILGRLVCDLPLKNFELTRLEDGEWVRVPQQPRTVDSSRHRTELRWEIEAPAHVYLLSFEKAE